jgi:glycosyltransferase involved in cell wall biosynthesis
MKDVLPKFSVIITTYNSQQSIQRVLDSIKKQEDLNITFEVELIIVDDCSTDDTLAIIKSNKLDYLSTGKNSGGPNKGRNTGLKYATGDFICIVDHDDEWHSNKIKSLLPFLNKAPIITSGYIYKDLNNNRETIICNNSEKNDQFLFFEKHQTFLNKLKRSSNGQNTYIGSIVYASSLKNIEFEENYGMLDYDWLLRLFYRQTSIEICQTLYTRYTERTNLSLNETYRLNDYNFSLKYVQAFKQNYPIEVAQSIKKINGSFARYYYLVNNMSKARKYFRKSEINLKTIFYFITTFIGSKIVKKHFNVFG